MCVCVCLANLRGGTEISVPIYIYIENIEAYVPVALHCLKHMYRSAIPKKKKPYWSLNPSRDSNSEPSALWKRHCFKPLPTIMSVGRRSIH